MSSINMSHGRIITHMLSLILSLRLKEGWEMDTQLFQIRDQVP